MAVMTDEDRKKKQAALREQINSPQLGAGATSKTPEYPYIPQAAKDVWQGVKQAGNAVGYGFDPRNLGHNVNNLNNMAVNAIGAGVKGAAKTVFSPETISEAKKAWDDPTVGNGPTLKRVLTGVPAAGEAKTTPLVTSMLEGSESKPSASKSLPGFGATPANASVPPQDKLTLISPHQTGASNPAREAINIHEDGAVSGGVQNPTPEPTKGYGANPDNFAPGQTSRTALPFEIDPNRSVVLTKMQGEDGSPLVRETINGPRHGKVDSAFSQQPGLGGLLNQLNYKGGPTREGAPEVSAAVQQKRDSLYGNWSESERQKGAQDMAALGGAAMADRTRITEEGNNARLGISEAGKNERAKMGGGKESPNVKRRYDNSMSEYNRVMGMTDDGTGGSASLTDYGSAHAAAQAANKAVGGNVADESAPIRRAAQMVMDGSSGKDSKRIYEEFGKLPHETQMTIREKIAEMRSKRNR